MKVETPKTNDLELKLKSSFGFSDFQLGQKEIIDSVLAGKNTFAVMPTGAGKLRAIAERFLAK